MNKKTRLKIQIINLSLSPFLCLPHPPAIGDKTKDRIYRNKNHESISQYKPKIHVKSCVQRKSNSFKHYLRKKEKEELNIKL